LLFDLKINRTISQIRQRKRREQKIREAEKDSSGNMEDVNPDEHENPQPRRIVGDYTMQQGLRYFSSIAIPNTARAVEMKLAYLTLISSHQFTRLDHEDPYTHLSTFYELTTIMGFEERDKESVYLRLFPFSLAGKAKEWLK